MLAVSFLGKKFSCDAQIEVPDETNEGGLKLSLRVHEMCKKNLKPHGPVLATLHVNVNSGRSNDVTKCKELLAFLKGQVLPKTLKMVSSKRLKKIKTAEKKDGGNWLRCIRPGTTEKRKEDNKSKSKSSQNTRGYSSDSEDCIEKCRGTTSFQASKADILATPRFVRPQCVRKINSKINENKRLSLKEDRKKSSRDKVLYARQKERTKESGPQRVQNEAPDWHSCSDVSASDSFVGFYSFHKSTKDYSSYSEIEIGQESLLRSHEGDLKFTRSSNFGLQRSANNLPLQEAIQNNRNCLVERCGDQEQSVKNFASLYVDKICKEALSNYVQQRSKNLVREYIANVIRSASYRFTQQEKSKPQTENCHFEEKENMIMEEIESPCFSNEWKYSRAFPTECIVSHRGNDYEIRNQEDDENSNSEEEVEVKDESDIQFEEFLEKKMVDSLELSGSDKPTSSSSNSSGQSVHIETLKKVDHSPLRNNYECHSFHNELIADFAVREGEKEFHTSNEMDWATGREASIGNFDTGYYFRQRPPYTRAMSESQSSERKQWSPLQTDDGSFSFHSSALSCMAAPKCVRSASCPVISEDDVMLENMLSHHRDVYDLLSKRSWIILHVSELWNGGKPMDALKRCIDFTGMSDVQQDAPYAQVTRDYALFLNILQQLPSSCSMWSLDLFVLVLPKLKGFISSQHHTSHVEMACGIINVVLKKVAVVVRRTSKANKNKDKELKLKACTNELKEIKDMATDVLQAVKSVKRSNTEDPASVKLVLKELLFALGTFFEQI